MSRFQPRVWDIEEQRFHMLSSIHFSEHSEIIALRFAFHGEDVLFDQKKHILMQNTGMKCSKTKASIYEGDVVLLDYQYGPSACEVRWCPIKHTIILHPIWGEKPKHKPHFRLAGKRGVFLIGNIYEPYDFPSKSVIKEMFDGIR